MRLSLKTNPSLMMFSQTSQMYVTRVAMSRLGPLGLVADVSLEDATLGLGERE